MKTVFSSLLLLAFTVVWSTWIIQDVHLQSSSSHCLVPNNETLTVHYHQELVALESLFNHIKQNETRQVNSLLATTGPRASDAHFEGEQLRSSFRALEDNYQAMLMLMEGSGHWMFCEKMIHQLDEAMHYFIHKHLAQD